MANTNRAEMECDNLDAAIFTGDSFIHKNQVAILRTHCERWLRYCKTVEEAPAIEEEDD